MAGILSKVLAVTIDLTSDKVRNRCMFPSIILMLYILLVFIILALQAPEKMPADQIEVISDLQNRYRMADSVESYSPSPRVKLKSTLGEVLDMPTSLNVVDFISNGDPNLPNCDASEREAIAGTMEFFRLTEVCRPVLKNNWQMSTAKGISTYTNLTFERGPVGRYGFDFSATDNTGNEAVRSQKFFVNIESNVSQIVIVNNQSEIKYDSFWVEPGKPLQPQPVLQVFDNNGKTVTGKRVVALAWPEPHFKGFGMQYAVWASKFAVLAGDVSQPSDEEGVARFKDLRVLGMNSFAVYLHFICDNAVSVSWDLFRSPVMESFGIPFFKMPMMFNSAKVPVVEVSFVGNYSTVVEEGKAFAAPVRVKVKEMNSGTALAGQLVIAELVAEDEEYFPQGYRQQEYGTRLKQLLMPFPAKYHEQFADPLLDDHEKATFEPILTDAKGEVVFTDLAFSVYGAAKKSFRIKFSCNGYSAISQVVYVQSSVAEVQFVNEPPHSIDVESSSVNEKLIPVLQILNSRWEGVPGKMPVLSLLDGNNGDVELNEAQISLFMNNTKANEEFEPSDENGMIKINIHYQFVRELTQNNIKMRFTVEGVSAVSSAFTIVNKNKDLQLCGSIIDFKGKGNGALKLDNGVPFDVSFLVLNEAGDPLPGAKAVLALEYNPGQRNWPPQQLLPVLNTRSSVVKLVSAGGSNLLTVQTDQQGIAYFDQVEITQGQNSTYSLSVSVYSESSNSASTAPLRQNYQMQKQQQHQLTLQKTPLLSTGAARNLQFDGESYIDGESLYYGSSSQGGDSQFDYSSISEYLDPESEIDFSQIEEQMDSSYTDPEAFVDDPSTFSDATEQLENFDLQASSSSLFSSSAAKKNGFATKMCFMSTPFQVFLKSTVQNLIVMSATRDDVNDQFEVKLQFQDVFNVPIAGYDSTTTLNIVLTEFPSYFAGEYMATAKKADFYKKLIEMTTNNAIADADGQVVYYIKIKPQTKGLLGIVFVCEGVFTLPQYLETEFYAHSVTIQTQPASNCGVVRRNVKEEEQQSSFFQFSERKETDENNQEQDTTFNQHQQQPVELPSSNNSSFDFRPDQLHWRKTWQQSFAASMRKVQRLQRSFSLRSLQGSGLDDAKAEYGWSISPNDFVSSSACLKTQALLVGNRIGQFQVVVKNNVSAPLQDYTVFAILDASQQSTDSEANKVILDIGDVYGNQNPVVLSPWRKAVTDTNGVATFEDLSFIDSRGFHCARLVFVVGYQGFMGVRSTPSNLYCFTTQTNMFVEVQAKYSKIILPNKNFPQPLTVVKRGPRSFLEQTYNFYFMAGLLYDLEGEEVENILQQSQIVLDNNVCYQLTLPGSGEKVSTPYCTIVPETSKDSITFTFKKLAWLLPGQQKFRLTFSTLMNFRVKEKKKSASAVMQAADALNVVMRLMKLVNDPAALYAAVLDELTKRNLVMPERLQLLLQQLQTTAGQLQAMRDAPTSNSPTAVFQKVQELAVLGKQLKTQLSDLLLAVRQSSETDAIKSSFQTSEIVINQQPPLNIYVKDLVNMEILLKNAGGVPLPRVPLKVALVQGKKAVKDLDNAESQDALQDAVQQAAVQAVADTAANAQDQGFQAAAQLTVTSGTAQLNEKFEKFLSEVGQAKMDLDSLQKMATKSSFAQVHPKKKDFQAKSSGKAIVTTQILEGSPGKTYHFQFESQKKLSLKTEAFLLKNHIVAVRFSNSTGSIVPPKPTDNNNKPLAAAILPESVSYDQAAKILTLKTTSLNKPLRILAQLHLALQYEDGYLPSPPYAKSLKFKVYRYIDPAEVQRQMNKAATSAKNLSADDLASLVNKDENSQQNIAKTLQSVFTVVMSAGNVYRLASPTEIYAPGSVEDQKEDTWGNLTLKNLQFKFSSFGKYQFAVIVDGIQSPLSFGVFVEKSAPKSFLELDYIQIFIDSGFIILLYFSVTLSSVHVTKERQLKKIKKTKSQAADFYQQQSRNSPLKKKDLTISPSQVLPLKKKYTSRPKYSLPTIPEEMQYRQLKRPKKPEISALALVATAIGILLILLQIGNTYMFIDSSKNTIGWFFRLCNSGIFLIALIIQFARSLSCSYFFQARNELFWEYTYQKLFQRPSKRWLKHLGRKDLLHQLEQLSLGNSNNRVSVQNEASNSPKGDVASPDNNNRNERKRRAELQLWAQFREERRELQKKNESVCAQILATLTPFRASQKRLCVEDVYFLPQRIIGSIFISMFSIAFIFYKVLMAALSVKDTILTTFLQTKAQFVQFVAAANRKASQALGNVAIDEPTFNSVQNIIVEAQKMLESFLDAMSRGILIAAFLALAFYLLSVLKMLYNFRQRVLEMRRGIYRYDVQKTLGNFQLGFQFLPFHVSNSMLAFIVFFIVFAIAFTFLLWPILWILLWDNHVKILTIVFSAVLSSLSLIIAKALIFDEPLKCYKNRALLPFFQLYQIYLSILAGILSAIVRFVKTVVIGVFTIYVVDETAFAGWVMRLAFADAVTKTYLIVLQINYLYNNPIRESFNALLKDAVAQRRLLRDKLALNGGGANGEGSHRQLVQSTTGNKIHPPLEETTNDENSRSNEKKLQTRLKLRNKMWLLLFMHRNSHLNLGKYRKKNIAETVKQLQSDSQQQKLQEQEQEQKPLIVKFGKDHSKNQANDVDPIAQKLNNLFKGKSQKKKTKH